MDSPLKLEIGSRRALDALLRGADSDARRTAVTELSIEHVWRIPRQWPRLPRLGVLTISWEATWFGSFAGIGGSFPSLGRLSIRGTAHDIRVCPAVHGD